MKKKYIVLLSVIIVVSLSCKRRDYSKIKSNSNQTFSPENFDLFPLNKSIEKLWPRFSLNYLPRINSIAISPDGYVLVGRNADNGEHSPIMLLNANTRKPIELPGIEPKGDIIKVAISKNGVDYFACGTRSSYYWKMKHGDIDLSSIKNYDKYLGCIDAAVFSHAHRDFIAIIRDNVYKICMIDLSKDNNDKRCHNIGEDDAQYHKIAFISPNTFIASSENFIDIYSYKRYSQKWVRRSSVKIKSLIQNFTIAEEFSKLYKNHSDCGAIVKTGRDDIEKWAVNPFGYLKNPPLPILVRLKTRFFEYRPTPYSQISIKSGAFAIVPYLNDKCILISSLNNSSMIKTIEFGTLPSDDFKFKEIHSFAFNAQITAITPDSTGKRAIIGDSIGNLYYFYFRKFHGTKYVGSTKNISPPQGKDIFSSFNLSADSKYLLIGTTKNSLEIWDIFKGKRISTYKSDYSIAKLKGEFFPANNNEVLISYCAGTSSNILKYNFQENKEIWKKNIEGCMISGKLNSDGAYYFLGTDIGKVKIIDLNTSNIVKDFNLFNDSKVVDIDVLPINKMPINDSNIVKNKSNKNAYGFVSTSSDQAEEYFLDGNIFVALSDKGEVKLSTSTSNNKGSNFHYFDLDHKKWITDVKSFKYNNNIFKKIAFIGNGRTIAVGTNLGVMLLGVNLKTGKQIFYGYKDKSYENLDLKSIKPGDNEILPVSMMSKVHNYYKTYDNELYALKQENGDYWTLDRYGDINIKYSNQNKVSYFIFPDRIFDYLNLSKIAVDNKHSFEIGITKNGVIYYSHSERLINSAAEQE